MNRFVIVCLCLSLALPFACFAEVDPDAYWFQNDDGTYGYDTEAYEHDVAVDMVQTSGVDLDPELYWKVDPNATVEMLYYFDFEAFEADYNAIMETLSPPAESPIEKEDTPDPYPVEWPEEDIGNETDFGMVDIENTPQMDEIDPVLELGEDTPMVYTLNDMRSTSDTGNTVILDGLKAVIRSVFGAYEPVTTTAVYTETVDGETVTTLVDVVAEGSAGVDYEYIAGVFLFGIMLFCMFKLLGGIVS